MAALTAAAHNDPRRLVETLRDVAPLAPGSEKPPGPSGFGEPPGSEFVREWWKRPEGGNNGG